MHEQTLCKLSPGPVTHLSALSQASLLHTTGNPPQPPLPGGGSPLCRSPSVRGALSTCSSQTSETVFSLQPPPSEATDTRASPARGLASQPPCWWCCRLARVSCALHLMSNKLAGLRGNHVSYAVMSQMLQEGYGVFCQSWHPHRLTRQIAKMHFYFQKMRFCLKPLCIHIQAQPC